MELKEIFSNGMSTCVIIFMTLLALGLLSSDRDLDRLSNNFYIKFFLHLSFFGFPICLVGWVWCR